MKEKRNILRISLITAGILVIGVGILVGGIALAQHLEESKVIETVYQDKDQQPVTGAAASADLALDSASDASAPGTTLPVTDPSQEITAATAAEAKLKVQSIMQGLFGQEQYPTRHLAASLDEAHNTYIIGEKTCIAFLNADNLNVFSFYFLQRVSSYSITEEEFEAKRNQILNDPTYFINSATELVSVHLADGRQVSSAKVDGVYFVPFDVSDENNTSVKGTYKVICEVLMNSGCCYHICFADQMMLDHVISYPSEEVCIANSGHLTNAPLFPEDWDYAILNPDYVEEYIPQINEFAELGPEDITVDEAMDIMIEYTKLLYDEEVERSNLSATFYREEGGVMTDYWTVFNQDYQCSINAVSGKINMLNCKREYSGADQLEYYSMDAALDVNNSAYQQLASDFVEDRLADGAEIESAFVNGSQIVFNGSQPVTILVDCNVLMKTGRSYRLSFIGSEKQLYWFSAHPTQHACVWGYWDESEASKYPGGWNTPQS